MSRCQCQQHDRRCGKWPAAGQDLCRACRLRCPQPAVFSDLGHARVTSTEFVSPIHSEAPVLAPEPRRKTPR